MSNLATYSSDPSVHLSQAGPRQGFQYVYKNTDDLVNSCYFLFLKRVIITTPTFFSVSRSFYLLNNQYILILIIICCTVLSPRSIEEEQILLTFISRLVTPIPLHSTHTTSTLHKLSI